MIRIASWFDSLSVYKTMTISWLDSRMRSQIDSNFLILVPQLIPNWIPFLILFPNCFQPTFVSWFDSFFLDTLYQLCFTVMSFSFALFFPGERMYWILAGQALDKTHRNTAHKRNRKVRQFIIRGVVIESSFSTYFTFFT